MMIVPSGLVAMKYTHSLQIRCVLMRPHWFLTPTQHQHKELR